MCDSLDYLGLIFKTNWIWFEFFSTFSCSSNAKLYDFEAYPALCHHAVCALSVMYRKSGVLYVQIRTTAAINVSKSAGIFTEIDLQLSSDCNIILNVAILQSPLKCLP
jgi:hypothetical protein